MKQSIKEVLVSATPANSRSPANCLFVYGTLMEGQIRHHLLEAGSIQAIVPASVSGQLLDFGEYPALHLSAGIRDRVAGELIRFEVLDKILGDIDKEEGPEFSREIVNVALANGGRQFAWTYVFASDRVPEHKIIPSGSWRNKDVVDSD